MMHFHSSPETIRHPLRSCSIVSLSAGCSAAFRATGREASVSLKQLSARLVLLVSSGFHSEMNVNKAK